MRGSLQLKSPKAMTSTSRTILQKYQKQKQQTPTSRQNHLRPHSRGSQYKTTSTGMFQLKQSSVQDQSSRKGQTVQTSDLFKSSYSRLSQLKLHKPKPNQLNEQLNSILEMIREQKQTITEKLQRVGLKADRYKRLYLEMKQEKDRRDRVKEEAREETREIYGKFAVILGQMGIEVGRVLPEWEGKGKEREEGEKKGEGEGKEQEVRETKQPKEPKQVKQQQTRQMDSQQIIKVQKFIIKKLVDRLEQERIQNRGVHH